MNSLKDLKMKPNKVNSIAVTGGIGSGKSLACQILADHNIPCISADSLGHEVLKLPEIIDKLVNEFGCEILENNSINRNKLGCIAFKRQNGSSTLNNILHPSIIMLLKKQLNQQTSLTAYEIPLLFEAGLQDLFDISLLITAHQALRKERIMKRPGMTESKADDILRSQMPESEKTKLADYVIENNDSQDILRNKLTIMLKYYNLLPGVKK